MVYYAIRKLGCQSGIMITASHNPRNTMAIKPIGTMDRCLHHDRNIIAEVNRVKSIEDIQFSGNKKLIEIIGKDFDKAFIEEVKAGPSPRQSLVTAISRLYTPPFTNASL